MADEKFYQEANDKEKDPKAESPILNKLHIPGPDGTKPATNKDAEDYLKTTDETLDTAGKVLKAGPVRFIKGANARANKGSIIGMASKNTFEFPVFVSKSVPLDYATATNSLLEQVYASYLQMAITLNPLIDKRTAEAGGPFSKFKTNITKYVEYTDMFYAHDAAYASYETDECVSEFHMISVTDREAQVINEAVDYQPLSEFSHYFQEADNDRELTEAEKRALAAINNKPQVPTPDTATNTEVKKVEGTKHPDEKIERTPSELERMTDAERLNLLVIQQGTATREFINAQIQEAKLRQELNENKNMSEDKRKKLEAEREVWEEKANHAKEDADNASNELKEKVNKMRLEREAGSQDPNNQSLTQLQEILNKRRKLRNEVAKSNFDSRKAELEYKKLLKDDELYEKRWKMEREKHAKDMMVRGPQFMDETKIQKLNTMKPLMMTAQLKVIDKKGGISAPVEYVVGVKTHCRLIEPETLPDVVRYPLQKMDRLTRKAKWRAGEMKFFDYLFNIPEKKQTAIDSKDPNKKWYRRLYELAHKKGDANVAKRISGNGHSGLIPNATIVVSQADVDNVKANTGINLLKGSSARSLCRELFLMAFIVIDMDTESIKVLLPDIHNDYEIHSLASVKKQLATLDTAGDKTRDMFKLLGR